MKAQSTAIVACVVVLALVMVSTSAVTYSWWSDSDETDITITTGSLDVSTEGFYVKHGDTALTSGSNTLPDQITIEYDDGRSANTTWWSDSDKLTIAGNPGDVDVEIGYDVIFSGNIDYKYLIDVAFPAGFHPTVSVMDEGGQEVGYGSWVSPTNEPSENFSIKRTVVISIDSIPANLENAVVKITNMITQYNNPIDIWNGSVPDSIPNTLVVDTADKVISINDAQAFAYLNTLNGVWDSSIYGSKWSYSIDLNTSIDLNNLAWTPIALSNFVAFNGNGHTIYNLNVSAGDNAGLCGSITCNDLGVTYVRDFNIVNAVVDGDEAVGVVIGNGMQAAVSGVVVDNAILTGNKYVGGIFGYGNGSVNGCVVKNSSISIPYNGLKEAGGLIGYLSNDGTASIVDKIISGNCVENVTVSAPTIASGLVSQPNSSNSGGAKIVIEDNTMVGVTIITADDSASHYVSNNVGERSIVRNNSAENCSTIDGLIILDETMVDPAINVSNEDVNGILKDVTINFPTFSDKVLIFGEAFSDAPADFVLKDFESVLGGISIDIKDDGGVSYDYGDDFSATVVMKIKGTFAQGNIRIYHEGVLVDGIQVSYEGEYTLVEFTANGFSSYVAVEYKAWDGTADTSWYNDDATEFTIGTAEQLAGLAALVDGGNDFAGKTITLTEDVNLYCMGSEELVTFNPIGDISPFRGTFDGGNNTIFNLYQSGWALGYEWGAYGSIGLFGELDGATIKNLTISGAESFVEGGDVGGITGSATGVCVFENITIEDSVFATYNNGLGGIIGWSGAGEYTFKDITISDDVVLGGLWGSFDSSIGGVVGQGEPGATYNFEDVYVGCRLDVYNDCTASYDYYNYRMCGMLIGRLTETTTIDGANYPDASKYNITCVNVTVKYGEWHDYHYCEPTPGYNGGRGMRVESGYAYDGLPADYDHSNCVDNHMNSIPFDQIFGGNQFGVKGLKAYDGVTVVYPVDDCDCSVCAPLVNG